VKNVFLMREKAVPADCTVLLVGGPEKDLLPETTAAIRDFVKKAQGLRDGRGRAQGVLPELVALLKDWNIEAGTDVVVDVSGMGSSSASRARPLAIEYPWHTITKTSASHALRGARSVQAGKGTVEGVSAQDLVKTSPVVAESDLASRTDQVRGGQGPHGTDRSRRGGDGEGPAPAPTPTRPPRPRPLPRTEGARGACRRGGRRRLRLERAPGFQGNQDFFLNAVAWLARTPISSRYGPRSPRTSPSS